MNVIIVCKISDDGQDLRFRVVVPGGSDSGRVSQIYCLKGKAAQWNGNPYLVYGKYTAEFTDNWGFNCSYTVARCHSGQL